MYNYMLETVCNMFNITPTDEMKWGSIKAYRNDLLTKCDWTQLSDAPLTEEQKNLWSIYRQQLRDIPQLFNNPDDVVFPTEPGGL